MSPTTPLPGTPALAARDQRPRRARAAARARAADPVADRRTDRAVQGHRLAAGRAAGRARAGHRGRRAGRWPWPERPALRGASRTAPTWSASTSAGARGRRLRRHHRRQSTAGSSCPPRTPTTRSAWCTGRHGGGGRGARAVPRRYAGSCSAHRASSIRAPATWRSPSTCRAGSVVCSRRCATTSTGR